MLLGEVVCQLLEDTIQRIKFPILALFPELYPYSVTAFCRRYKRNVTHMRAAIQQIMDDRRKGLRKGNFGDDGDLLGILLQNELYAGDEEKTKDELVIFFLAGNETVKTSSTNTVCYLAMHDDIRARYMDEITSVLDRSAENFDELFTSEDVESFSFVRNCWYESMRLQPPASGSSLNRFSKTVTIKGIEFTPTTGFSINFDAIHKDPKEWIEPERYNPDRFDP